MKVLLGQPERGRWGWRGRQGRQKKKNRPEESHKIDNSCEETEGEGVREENDKKHGEAELSICFCINVSRT